MVALKRLDGNFGRDGEFFKEIMMLSRYRHENLISLLGFCTESGEMILVYEYASRGSLDKHLSSPDLSWNQRLRICIGAAGGLAYLHNPGQTQRVLHRDIKSSNILLDENWNAKVADLGLSKIGPANPQYDFLVTNPVGKIGYWDPLYAETGLLTKESDVYSFGVVLFEVLCGRLCIEYSDHRSKRTPLTVAVRRSFNENKLEEIIYGVGGILEKISPDCLERFSAVAYQCLSRELDTNGFSFEGT